MMKKFFFRRLRKYILGMMLPMVIIFAISFWLEYNSSLSEVKQSGEQTVNAVTTNFELVVSNVLYQNDLLSNTTRMNIALRDILSGEKVSYSESIFLSSLKSVLNSISSSHDYIDSIYIYYDDYPRYFTSTDGVRQLTDNFDINWLSIYQEMSEEQNSLITTRVGNTYLNKLDTISIFERTLLQKGCIIVNINLARYQDLLNSMLANENEIIFLLDHNKKVLVQETQGGKQISLTGNESFESCAGDWMNIDGKDYLITMKKASSQDVYVVSAIKASSVFTNMVLWARIYLIIFIINCVVITTIAYQYTKRTFDQIHYMIDIFDNAEKGIFKDKYEPVTTKDEYDVVMNNVIHMFVNNTYLKTKLQEKQFREEIVEQKALQLQINPHFLFNTLQSIDMEVGKMVGLGSTASKMIGEMSDILKYSLGSVSTDVTVCEEIKYLKKYVEIQKYRFGDSIITYYEVDEDALEDKLFRLALQPIVENSILHGVRYLKRQGYIKVKIFEKDDKLRCIVTDNGVGIPKEKLKELYANFEDESVESIGLTNVHRRLILKYGKSAGLVIRSKEKLGTSISFEIPIKK